MWGFERIAVSNLETDAMAKLRNDSERVRKELSRAPTFTLQLDSPTANRAYQQLRVLLLNHKTTTELTSATMTSLYSATQLSTSTAFYQVARAKIEHAQLRNSEFNYIDTRFVYRDESRWVVRKSLSAPEYQQRHSSCKARSSLVLKSTQD